MPRPVGKRLNEVFKTGSCNFPQKISDRCKVILWCSMGYSGLPCAGAQSQGSHAFAFKDVAPGFDQGLTQIPVVVGFGFKFFHSERT